MTAFSQIRTWYEFALQQIAAESYLDQYNLSDQGSLIEALTMGNTPPDFPKEPAYTKMTESQAERFVEN